MKSVSGIVVDDEEQLASLYGQFLSSTGFETISFTKPLVALEHYRQNPYKYSMVLTDLRMPGMNGLELATEIRKIDSSVKIFLITAFDIFDLEMDPIFQSAGISKVIQKPVKLSTLRNIVQDSIKIS